MSWQLVALAALFLEAGHSLLHRVLAKKHPADGLLSVALMHLLVVTPVGVASALLDGDLDFSFPLETWFFFLTSGTILAGAKIAKFFANSEVDAAQFALVSNLEVVVTIAVSTTFLTHTLNTIQFIGVALLIIAAVLAVSYKINRSTLKIDRYTALAMLSAVLFGVGTSNESYLLGQMTFATYLALAWGFQTLAMAAFASKKLATARRVITFSYLKYVLSVGLLRVTAGIGFLYALQKSGNSSLFAGIFSYQTVLVVLGSYIFLKERQAPKIKLAATLMATVGLALLI